MRKSLAAAKQENQIMEESLIQSKLKWANCEHEKATMKMEFVDMSEELQELKERLKKYEPQD